MAYITFSSASEAAEKAIEGMDKMIGAVDAARAGLGAIQNRLESSIRNQANVSANQADARSRIRDADFAEESANLSQQSIIQQAATSMLMQANTRPQLGLSLLQANKLLLSGSFYSPATLQKARSFTAAGLLSICISPRLKNMPFKAATAAAGLLSRG